MRGPATAALLSGNIDRIAEAFEATARLDPRSPAYANWASISLDGANAARNGSIAGVKAACRGCHGQYQARYKAELSSRPLT